MTERALLNMAEVARKLGRSVEWFYRNRRRLEREHGFPASIAGLGKRWDPAAIDAWLDRQMAPELRRARAAPGSADGEPGEIIDWEHELGRRARRIAERMADGAA